MTSIASRTENAKMSLGRTDKIRYALFYLPLPHGLTDKVESTSLLSHGV